MPETVFSTPEQIIAQLSIPSKAVVADFGCGSGFFTLPLARVVTEGVVYALDVIKDSLSAVESKAKLEGISNIKTIHCNLEKVGSSSLEEGSVNFVLMRNILFQSQEKDKIVQEAKRVLANHGTLILIEWIPGSPLVPKGGWLISKDEAQKMAEGQGFSFERELSMDKQHYGLTFRK